MHIVCGTDFSPGSEAAIRVAAAWARKRGEGLVVVHAGDEADARTRMAEQVAHAGGVPAAELRAVDGVGHGAVVEACAAAETSLVVVGAVGAGREPGWLGGTAERVARGASVPTLVVRDADRLTRWLDGGEPLRVLAAVDGVEAGARCVSWMAGLATMGPVAAMLGHVVWPPEEHRRLGAAGPIDLVSLAPEVKAAVAGRLATLAAGYPGAMDIELRVGWGKVPVHLAHLAAEVRADLVVVALPRRGALDRLWRGSVTHGLLATAETNVVCVPLPA